MKTPQTFLLVLTLPAALTLSACGQLTAKTIAVSTLLHVPAVTIEKNALAAGTLPAAVTIPESTLALSFVGERQGDGFTAAPAPVSGATVSLVEVNGASTPMRELGGGSYSTAGSDAGVRYVANGTYQLKVENGGQTYIAEIEKVPGRESILELHPEQGFIDHPANTPLTFVRPDPPPSVDRNLGFTTVIPLDFNGGQGTATFTNIPSDAVGIVKLVLAQNEWKTTAVTIPATAFPEAGKNYLILLQTAKMGGPKTDNLFIASALIAGEGDMIIVKTH